MLKMCNREPEIHNLELEDKIFVLCIGFLFLNSDLLYLNAVAIIIYTSVLSVVYNCSIISTEPNTEEA